MHVVVMFEPAHKSETLSLTEQVNEVFGPFPDEEAAERWLNRMLKEPLPPNLKYRKWLIIPTSDPNAVLQIDQESN
jgi:hypothetical protein